MGCPIRKSSIKLVNAKGKVVYSDFLKDFETYSKKFNFETFIEGRYFLEVENSLREIVYSITVTKKDVEIISMKERLKPVYRNEDGIVYLNYLNLDKDDLKISVYDSDDRLLFAKTYIDETIVQNVFNFKKAIKDNYSIVVKDSANKFYHFVEVE